MKQKAEKKQERREQRIKERAEQAAKERAEAERVAAQQRDQAYLDRFQDAFIQEQMELEKRLSAHFFNLSLLVQGQIYTRLVNSYVPSYQYIERCGWQQSHCRINGGHNLLSQIVWGTDSTCSDTRGYVFKSRIVIGGKHSLTEYPCTNLAEALSHLEIRRLMARDLSRLIANAISPYGDMSLEQVLNMSAKEIEGVWKRYDLSEIYPRR